MPTSITVIGHNFISEMTFFCSRFIVFLYCIVVLIKSVTSDRAYGATDNFCFWKIKLCEIYGHLIVCRPASEITVSKSFELLGNWDLSSLSCRPILLCSAIFIGITETLPQDGISEICNVCRSVLHKPTTLNAKALQGQISPAFHIPLFTFLSYSPLRIFHF